MIDYHIHTKASPDAEQALGDAVNRARKLGITHIAITDHYDFLDGESYESWHINDLQDYSRKIDEQKHKYNDIHIAKGIEVGHNNKKLEDILNVLKAVDFDFIISSTHCVDEVDPYFPEYFKGRTKQETYSAYLKEIRDSIDLMDERVSVIGHIGYAARYAPYEDKNLRYEDFREIIDELLLKIVKRGFGIEINTSNYGRYTDETMPPEKIIKRYRDLGGEIITIGSDAHKLDDIGKKYETARQIALEAGFKYVSVFKNLKEEKIPL